MIPQEGNKTFQNILYFGAVLYGENSREEKSLQGTCTYGRTTVICKTMIIKIMLFISPKKLLGKRVCQFKHGLFRGVTKTQ